MDAKQLLDLLGLPGCRLERNPRDVRKENDAKVGLVHHQQMGSEKHGNWFCQKCVTHTVQPITHSELPRCEVGHTSLANLVKDGHLLSKHVGSATQQRLEIGVTMTGNELSKHQ